MLDRLPPEGADIEIKMGDFGAFKVCFRQSTGDEGHGVETRWFPPADPYMKAFTS